MADKSIQEKQRRRQKAIKDPVCASRVIKNPLYGTGWSGKLSPEEKNLATSLLDDAAAMYSLQIQRDREVEPLSLHNAIFWEHHQLSDQRIVSTPALIWEQQQQLNDLRITTGVIHDVPFFSTNKSAWKESLQQVLKQPSSSSASVEIHHVFSNIRDREFTVWPVLVEGFWITIIMRVVEMDIPVVQHGVSSNYYFDRKVNKLAIVDPVYEDREARWELIFGRLKNLLRQGCIYLSGDALVQTLTVDQVEEEWESGYMSYAISREFLRRLKILIHRRQRQEFGEPDSNPEKQLLWTAFEETPSIDGYREAMMSACSNYVIEASGYRIRSALEVPSVAAGHVAKGLRPHNAGISSEVLDEKINIGDQTRRFSLKIDLPEEEDDHEDENDVPERNILEEESEDDLPQETTTPNTPPKSPEPDTEAQGPRPDPPSPQNDPASELRENLQAIATAAKNLTEDVQVITQASEDVVMSDVGLEERASTPPTQQEVDIDEDPSVEGEEPEKTLVVREIQQASTHDDAKVSAISNEPQVNSNTPEQDQTVGSKEVQEPENKAPEAIMEDPGQSEELSIPNSAPESQDTNNTTVVPEPADDINNGKTAVAEDAKEEATIKASIERDESLPPATTATETETAASLAEETDANDKESDSIFGNGETPRSPTAKSEDLFVPEEEAEEEEDDGWGPVGYDPFNPKEEEDEEEDEEERGDREFDEEMPDVVDAEPTLLLPTVTIIQDEESVNDVAAADAAAGGYGDGDGKTGNKIDDGTTATAGQDAAGPRRSLSPSPAPPPPPPAGSPALTPAPTEAPANSSNANGGVVIPGLSIAANTFSWSPLGKREHEEYEKEDGEEGKGEDDKADDEKTAEPPLKRQKVGSPKTDQAAGAVDGE